MILTCVVSVFSASPFFFFPFSLLLFFFLPLHGINPGDENVMEQVHFAKRF